MNDKYLNSRKRGVAYGPLLPWIGVAAPFNTMGNNMNNRHDLTPAELAEVFHEAGQSYVRSGDRLGYINELKRLGIDNATILENLRELDILRAELFNQALATMEDRAYDRRTRAA